MEASTRKTSRQEKSETTLESEGERVSKSWVCCSLSCSLLASCAYE